MRRRMGRPSLVGTMARTAVITGTATATMNAMAPKGSPPQAATPHPAAAPAAPSLTEATIAKLKDLGELHASGVLSAEEFAQAKAKLLA
jgi:hypothetical protein